MFLPADYKSPPRLWSYTYITELLGFILKPILAGDLNAMHRLWNSNVAIPSG
jgi:hypothetical protein